MVVDKVSNLIVDLKNASLEKKETVDIPYTKFSNAILELLEKEGYVESIEKKGKGIKKRLVVSLKYDNDVPKINDVRRVSKFSRRVYAGAKDVRPFKNGYGLRVLSTPKGVVSDKMARMEKVGGEVLFEIW